MFTSREYIQENAEGMLSFRELTLADKACFDHYLDRTDKEMADWTFTNFFMWRKEYGLRFAEFGGFLICIFSPQQGEPYAFAPIGEGTQQDFYRILSCLEQYFETRGFELNFQKCNLDQAQRLQDYFGERCKVEADRDKFDYVYQTQDLIRLEGKKYDGKRNHIHKLMKQHVCEYVPLTQDLISVCLQLNQAWCEALDCYGDRQRLSEYRANQELLHHLEVLQCEGGLLRIDGKFEAFSIGELLTPHTAVIHIDKANTKIPGIYQRMHQQFAEHHWYFTQFINREEDLGIPGLRQAKLSYHPHHLVEKFKVGLLSKRL